MIIKKLVAEHVKRLSVVDITPDGNLITIGGKNGSGKSSVLDSIAYALGGNALVPSEPIHTGETEAKITVNLGEYVITRRFYRDYGGCMKCGHLKNEHSPSGQCQTQVDPVGDLCECHEYTATFGPTKSVLTVTNADGSAKFSSPQALLDSLYGKLTFDPLAFSREPAKKQNEILRQLVNLDFTILDKNIAEATSERRLARAAAASAASYLASLPHHDIEETEEIQDAVLQEELKAAEAAKEVADRLSRELDTSRGSLNACRKYESDTILKIARLEEQLVELKKNLESERGRIARLIAEQESLTTEYEQARAAIPHTDDLFARMKFISDTNRKVRENKAHKAAELDVLMKEAEMTRLENLVAELTEMRALALRNTKYPVDGLALTDDGVTYNGLPLEQVSSSVQLRVSVAIGLALNPRLKVLLVRNGNLLDEDGLKVIAEMAQQADAQVWMEYVTSDKSGVAVMLEDGHRA